MGKMGRPVTGNAKEKVVKVRVTDAELDKLRRAADAAHMTVSDLLRETALTGADAVLSGRPEDVKRWALSTSNILITAIGKGV